jgi:Uma2 family endonuclease
MTRTALRPHTPGPERKLTYEEFLAWADEDTWAEWVDGEVIVLSPASIPHQRLVRFLLSLLELFTRTFDLGEVLSAPTQMRLRRVRSGREPDLHFIAKAHLDRVQPTFIDGPADLVVEIVSPESDERDRVDKYGEYEAAGIREYWLLDRDRRDAAFFRLDGNGHYQRVLVDDSGIFHSEVLPGFWLRIDWLWQDPPPTLQAARELGLLPAAPVSGE